MAEVEFKFKSIWFQGQCPFRQGSSYVIWLSGNLGHTCLGGLFLRENTSRGLFLELQISPFLLTQWTLLYQTLQLKCHLFFSHFCCIDFILLCVAVTCLGGFSLKTWHMHEGKISSWSFLISFTFYAHNRCVINVKNDIVALRKHGESGL